MRITQQETQLKGNWIFDQGKMVEDQTTVRINWLIENLLIKIATDETGWLILYKDPNDGRYWELSYPDSEVHGGGAPMLTYLSAEEVKAKYGL